MRLPKRTNSNYSGNTEKEIIQVDTSQKFEMSLPDFENDKEKTNYIKNVEKLVRGSMEYRNYINLLKTKLDLTKCAFFKNIDVKNVKISLEMHHYPFTLYDIVNIVLEKRVDKDESINEILVAEEVMRLHYENKVGLVPLTLTIHQLVHEGQQFIPINFVHGNFRAFLAEYDDYVMELHKTYIKSIESTTRKIMEGDAKFVVNAIERKTIEIDDKNSSKEDLYINNEKNNKKIV